MDWKRKGKIPLIKDRQIIIAAWDKKSKGYRYAVVFYHDPLGVWYGGPGIMVKTKDIDWWAEIPAPEARGR